MPIGEEATENLLTKACGAIAAPGFTGITGPWAHEGVLGETENPVGILNWEEKRPGEHNEKKGEMRMTTMRLTDFGEPSLLNLFSTFLHTATFFSS